MANDTVLPHSFRVYAHRGDSAHAPGNSAQAFQQAINAGAPIIETDVRVTADGILILEHDEDIGGLLVADATLAELRNVNPTLLTVAAALRDFGSLIPFCWEVKAPRMVPALVTLIEDLVPLEIARQTEYTSFVWSNVLAVQTFSPKRNIGWLTSDWNQAVIERVTQAGVPQICPPAALVLATPDLVQVAHHQGLSVRVWSVPDVSLVGRLAAVGVEGGTVNFPAEALAVLSS